MALSGINQIGRQRERSGRRRRDAARRACGVNKCLARSASTWLNYCSISGGCNLIPWTSVFQPPPLSSTIFWSYPPSLRNLSLVNFETSMKCKEIEIPKSYKTKQFISNNFRKQNFFLLTRFSIFFQPIKVLLKLDYSRFGTNSILGAAY